MFSVAYILNMPASAKTGDYTIKIYIKKKYIKKAEFHRVCNKIKS